MLRHPKTSHDQSGILRLVLQHEKTSIEKQYNWLVISSVKYLETKILDISLDDIKLVKNLNSFNP